MFISSSKIISSFVSFQISVSRIAGSDAGSTLSAFFQMWNLLRSPRTWWRGSYLCLAALNEYVCVYNYFTTFWNRLNHSINAAIESFHIEEARRFSKPLWAVLHTAKDFGNRSVLCSKASCRSLHNTSAKLMLLFICLTPFVSALHATHSWRLRTLDLESISDYLIGSVASTAAVAVVEEKRKIWGRLSVWLSATSKKVLKECAACINISTDSYFIIAARLNMTAVIVVDPFVTTSTETTGTANLLKVGSQNFEFRQNCGN